ncbi:Asp23/Gls24 family envelope stress response protein [Deinococcus humi]|uniref:Putative alkaline shock family protein YloU n=1 Tax=Deinococcus humi TaxID=662880 RepID=A0A7W8NDM9_9DEIO|nr:Asp23/Gls24 family envelope stress response protein [Deinococcus humi]MBB5361770.1 putative alkaline shock family protein YloU [Deinococcus humi]GGO23775.1 alkaline-shock protein [Deinococcus humi]
MASNPTQSIPAPSSDVEISKNVLMEIAATTITGIEGTEVASAPLNMGAVLRNQSGARKSRALRVTRDGGSVSVDVGLNINFGQNLVNVSRQVQRAVCENIELMTGLKVSAVNVTVQGVCVPAAPATRSQP